MRSAVIALALMLAACGSSGGALDNAVAEIDNATAESAATTEAANEGMVSVESKFGFAETLARLNAAIADKGLNAIATIDHAANAQSAGLTLRPTTVVLFGAPAVGTKLMAEAQTAGLDLPQRMLVIADEQGTVRLIYNDPVWIAQRHGITDQGDTNATIATTLAGIAAVATGT